MKQILSWPVWVIVLAMMVVRRPRVISTVWMRFYVLMLEDLYHALPVPRTWWERWVVRTLIEWIDREKDAALKLVRLGATLILFE